ncbi:hypothetical protein DPMN_134513 [Dreissena polymorpha]|uniref:Uncharacterized protein n=1 Tax=Dreissena polymorpha TaxID=45954 RepID=A0A9D4JAS1_DREPO|nr:hypothetical protein DPMN_134513 [Dreissena polymorpha]
MRTRKKTLEKRFSLIEAKGRFKTACNQIFHLLQRLREIKKRYKMTQRSGNRVFRYNLRLKMSVIEGVCYMYYTYAYHKADRIAELRRDLFNDSTTKPTV